LRTSEGKQTVAQNARKHGLLSQRTLLPDEDPSELSALRESVRESLKPEGEWETILTDRIVQSLWRLQRIARVEAGLLASARHQILIEDGRKEARRHRRSQLELLTGDDDVITNRTAYENAMKGVQEAESLHAGDVPMLGRAFVATESTFSTLSRYESTIERGLYKALHELQRLQAARSGVPVPPPITGDVDVSVTLADDGRGDAPIDITKQTQIPDQEVPTDRTDPDE
jgi:hypothetical protein